MKKQVEYQKWSVKSDSERLLEVICDVENLRARQNVLTLAVALEAVLITFIILWK